MKRLLARIKAKRDKFKWWLVKYDPEIAATILLAFAGLVALLV